jgi:hypothetical protein
MDAIKHAISPEQLAIARELFDRVPVLTGSDPVETIDRRLREKTDAQAEADDRNRHERRKAAALSRR